MVLHIVINGSVATFLHLHTYHAVRRNDADGSSFAVLVNDNYPRLEALALQR